MIGPFRAAALALSVPTAAPQIAPWTDDSHLQSGWPWLWSDLFGADVPVPLTRAEALLVPAVARGRHLICATLARLPVDVMRGDTPAAAPYWCQGTDGQIGDLSTDDARRWAVGPQSPFHRMLATADDLLFYGWSMWLVTRRAAEDGRPARMLHLPYGAWSIDADGVITDADARPFPDGALIAFQGMSEGLLALASRTIRAAGTLEAAAADIAAHPLRFELHQTTDITLTDDERRGLVSQTRAALSSNDGVLFTNAAIETKTYPQATGEALLVGGRNAAALDVARHLNMPGAMIDATSEGASLEYQTTQTRNQQWLDYGLTAYMDAITARLSMDDVLPEGQRAVFDTTSLTALAPAATGPTLED